MDRGYVRRWGTDLLTIAVGIAVLAVCAVVARRSLTAVETAVFRAVNDLPEALFPVVWPLMQYGTFITIPVLSLMAFAMRRWRLGLALLTAGVSVYAIARLVKVVVDRGRPGGVLADVRDRESFAADSLGFPSGHAAVAAALTVVAFAFLPRKWAIVAMVVAGVVMAGRLYVGAHLPLDIVGGAGLGVVAGAAANLIMGVPRPDRPHTDEEAVRAAAPYMKG